jgi:hypothetical protein
VEEPLNGWEKIGDTWQKRFPMDGSRQLTVIVGQEEGSVDGLSFRESAANGTAEEDRSGTPLEEWIDSLSPEALIEIIAGRDKYLADLSETTS